MNSFTYSQAHDVPTALKEITSVNKSKFIAGGTNLTDLIKARVEYPSHLIDIRRLPLNQITELDGGGLRLGALVTNADTAYNPLIEVRYPLLAQAILAGASAQLRNMATNGGNPLQRTRCYYFYDTATACNKREPGTGCSAINGFNRIHAILGASTHCIAVHPSDMAVALAALGAAVQVIGPAGERSIPFLELHRLPGNTPQIDTNLATDEIITAIDLPAQGFAHHYTYLKIRDRSSYAFALVSVAAALQLEGSTIKEVRVALGGVAHKPWRKPEAEAKLVGEEINIETCNQLAVDLLVGAQGFGHNNFKIELAKKAIVRALLQAAHKQELA